MTYLDRPAAKCAVEGCSRKPKARGWCNTHYERWRRNGDPTLVIDPKTVNRHPNPLSPAERVLRRIVTDPVTGCWIWQGAKSSNGYGRVGISATRNGATHRVLYEDRFGPVPQGMDLDHVCRNRACCNPDHLEIVSRAENNRRGFAARQGLGHAVPLVRVANRKTWLRYRRSVLGATDAVAVLGLSPYRTPLDVYLEKTGRVEPPDIGDRYAVAKGNALEPLLIKEWANRNQARLLTFARLMAHPDYPHIACSPDAAGEIDGEVVLCEIKTAGWRQRDVWWDEAQLVPDQYLAQVAVQLAVTGLSTAHVFADVAGDLRQVEINHDPAFDSWALPELDKWWHEHVVADVAPDPHPIRDYSVLNLLWRPEPGLTIEADRYMVGYILEYQHAAGRAKEWKAEQDRLRGLIRIAMREATAVEYGGEKVVSLSKSGALTVKPQHREEILQ